MGIRLLHREMRLRAPPISGSLPKPFLVNDNREEVHAPAPGSA